MIEEIKKAKTAAIAAQYQLQHTINAETFAIASESGGMGVIDSGKLSHVLSKYLAYVHGVERRLYELLQKEDEQKKRIDELEKALSTLLELDESEVWTADAWDECFNLARKTLKGQTND